MKTLILALTTVALAATPAVKADILSPNVVSGALIGGVAGAVIGNNSGNHRGGEGAIVGAVAGGLIGAVVDNSRANVTVYGPQPTRIYAEPACPPAVVYAPAPRVIYRAPEVVVRRPAVVYEHPRVYVEPRHDHYYDHAHRW